MKTKDQTEITRGASGRRNLTPRTAVASLALAAATIPIIAGEASGTVSKEDPDSIRPFQIHFSDETVTDLRRRINSTKWPDRETVTDASQGVQLATIQKLAQY